MKTKPPTPTSTETLAEFAGRVLDSLCQTIVSFETGASTGDVEAVHAMRVSSRRLRAGLSNFAVCLSRDFRRSLRKEINTLADTLGRVRDLDVMIEALDQLQQEQPASRRATIVRMQRALPDTKDLLFKAPFKISSWGRIFTSEAAAQFDPGCD